MWRNAIKNGLENDNVILSKTLNLNFKAYLIKEILTELESLILSHIKLGDKHEEFNRFLNNLIHYLDH